ncbi:hypothetical protein NDU88_001263 [Pleurodeles waltl]|uniref:Uncharacterized protein n=1 Tax=Pleurodeles waltl TaxID=8319 RepID=A0AAV7KT01_PLEWA|nr:hypothetical protein NDU88_001263 [Pleurodeles waltl]
MTAKRTWVRRDHTTGARQSTSRRYAWRSVLTYERRRKGMPVNGVVKGRKTATGEKRWSRQKQEEHRVEAAQRGAHVWRPEERGERRGNSTEKR